MSPTRAAAPSAVGSGSTAAPSAVGSGSTAAPSAARRATAAGTVLGTPAWMAPEQYTGAATTDPRVDVWGVGAILFWMLTGNAPNGAARSGTGRPASTADDDVTVLADASTQATTRTTPVDPVATVTSAASAVAGRSDIPRPLRAIAATCLAPSPADRYDSVDDVLSDLRRWRDGGRVSVHRESLLERATRLISRYRTPIILVLTYLLVRIAIYLWGRM